MTPQKRVDVIAIAVAGAIALYLMYRHHQMVLELNANPTPDNVEGMLGGVGNGFTAPYYSTTPGVDDSSYILNGGQPFQSVINVNVNPDIAQFLSRNYIPLFGFVGVVATGYQAPMPQANKIQAPPPPAFAFVAPPAPSRPNIGVSAHAV